jgi:hypothetical protein
MPGTMRQTEDAELSSVAPASRNAQHAGEKTRQAPDLVGGGKEGPGGTISEWQRAVAKRQWVEGKCNVRKLGTLGTCTEVIGLGGMGS